MGPFPPLHLRRCTVLCLAKAESGDLHRYFQASIQKSFTMSINELACTYSALILADDDVPVTAEKINTILKAANVEVETIWPSLFAKALASVNIRDIITNVGSAVGSAPAAGGGGGGAAAEAAEEKKEEEKKEESEDEEDDDMGFGLF